MIWPTWVLVLIGIAGTIAAICTLRALNKQVAEAVTQSRAALKSADAAAQSAVTASKALEDTTKSIRLQQRCWIAIPTMEVDGYRNDGQIGKIRVRVTLKNTGLSPAMNVRSRVLVAGSKDGDRLPFDNYLAIEGKGSNSIIFPGEEIYSINFSREMSPETMSNISAQKFFIWVFGRVEYRDVFDVPHWLNFCGLMDPDGQHISIHGDHNEMDRNV